MKTYISYLRVSTQKQGVSGLGLEAQRTAVAAYVESVEGELLEEYVEIESSRNDRPVLTKALHMCKLTGSTLVTAKLDRLARSCSFISNLIESEVDFVPADLPQANTVMLQMLSIIAEYERKQISDRTRAALAAYKTRGPRMCSIRKRMTYQLGEVGQQNLKVTDEGRRKGGESMKRKADKYAKDVLPIINHHREKGLSFNQIASALNGTRIKTARGKEKAWTARSVINVLNRCG